ncbi:MAG: 1-pyrroline-5-carboxylate dehydrogenase, partial [Candidatus Dormibacteraeota bacterium]|nr:1-pyrroline-5-carboxylate dehydrogenase [Candidatus Dormibacteraeota bacterium]
MTISVPSPHNEPALAYAPGSAERAEVRRTLDGLAAAAPHRLPMRIDGRDVDGDGAQLSVSAPHRHDQVLAAAREATA